MRIGDDVHISDELVAALVACGRQAHRVAQAHHNDPGSNGFTFGTDRYQRATQLAVDVLVDHGFHVVRRGAGLVARGHGLEIQFAVARGPDLSDPASFDADSSPARRRIGLSNATQLMLDGMPEPAAAPVVHLVWSGTPETGQTAVHLGRLVLGAGDRLDWAVLLRVDRVPGGEPAAPPAAGHPVTAYADQPIPELRLPAAAQARRA